MAPTNGFSRFPLLREPPDVGNGIEQAVARNHPGEIEQARALAEFEQPVKMKVRVVGTRKLDLVAADEERRLLAE